MSGALFKLNAGGMREMHWHDPNEWAYVISGTCRATLVDQGNAHTVDSCEWHHKLTASCQNLCSGRVTHPASHASSSDACMPGRCSRNHDSVPQSLSACTLPALQLLPHALLNSLLPTALLQASNGSGSTPQAASSPEAAIMASDEQWPHKN